jgi:hypothetical protein
MGGPEMAPQTPPAPGDALLPLLAHLWNRFIRLRPGPASLSGRRAATVTASPWPEAGRP